MLVLKPMNTKLTPKLDNICTNTIYIGDHTWGQDGAVFFDEGEIAKTSSKLAEAAGVERFDLKTTETQISRKAFELLKDRGLMTATELQRECNARGIELVQVPELNQSGREVGVKDYYLTESELESMNKQEQEFQQFENEGFTIERETEEIGSENVEAAVAHYKGVRLGVMEMEAQVHPDNQVGKSDAQILADFGGLAYFKKEFAQEIEKSRVPDAVRQQVEKFCNTPSKVAALDRELDRED